MFYTCTQRSNQSCDSSIPQQGTHNLHMYSHVPMASNCIFQIKGNYLDTLARISLWEVGLDYGHGTGHGVGAYLNVHEGPMGISWRPYPDDP